MELEIEFKKDFKQLKGEFERHNLDLNEDYKKIMYTILKELINSRKVRLKLNSTKTPFIPQIQLSIEEILKLAELDKKNEKLVRDALFALSVYNYAFIYDTIKNEDGSYKKLNYYIAYTCEILYIETEFVDYERKNITDRKLTAAIWDDDLLDFCDLICYKILSEQRNYSNKELLEAFKQYYSADKEIETAKITRAMNKFIQIKNLKAIKNDRFYIEKQRVRGFVYLYEHKNHKSVVEFINSHESESEKIEVTEQLPSDSIFSKTVIISEKDYSNDIPF